MVDDENVKVTAYTVGPLTMREVFEKHGIENVADWQIVLDAMEKALEGANN